MFTVKLMETKELIQFSYPRIFQIFHGFYSLVEGPLLRLVHLLDISVER